MMWASGQKGALKYSLNKELLIHRYRNLKIKVWIKVLKFKIKVLMFELFELCNSNVSFCIYFF